MCVCVEADCVVCSGDLIRCVCVCLCVCVLVEAERAVCVGNG